MSSIDPIASPIAASVAAAHALGRVVESRIADDPTPDIRAGSDAICDTLETCDRESASQQQPAQVNNRHRELAGNVNVDPPFGGQVLDVLI
jgi:hypothetical protein